MDVSLVVAFAVIGFMLAVALSEAVRVVRLNRQSDAQVGIVEATRPIRPRTFQLVLLVALTIAVGIYFYGRYAADAQRDREITACMRGHDSARAMCEQFIDLRRRSD